MTTEPSARRRDTAVARTLGRLLRSMTRPSASSSRSSSSRFTPRTSAPYARTPTRDARGPSKSRRRFWVWPLVACWSLAIASLGACGTNPEPTSLDATATAAASTPASLDPSPPPSVWGPLAVVPPQEGSDSARMQGTLQITESCVVLVTTGGPIILVWPAGRTAWDPDQRVVRFANVDGTVVSAGDGRPVVVGGSADSEEESGRSIEEWLSETPWVQPPARDCPLDTRWWVGALGS